MWMIALALLSLSAPLLAPADEIKPFLTLDALRAQYGDPDGHLLRIGEIEVYYKDEGAGPALLRVHGSVGSLRAYDGVANRLKNRDRVIRYDVPGQGLSGPVSDDAARRFSPADIPIALLNGLGVAKVTAVGVSSGGTLCITLAARRPDLVDRLILANTPSDPVVTSHMNQPDDFLDAQQQARETGFQSQHFWDLFLSFFAGDPARMTPLIRSQFYDFNRRTPESNAIALVAKVADHDKAVAAMTQVAAPTLLLWGAKDPLLPPAAAKQLEGYLTRAPVSLLLLPDVGHFPPLEVPERFADIVADYIEAVTPP